MRSVLFPFDDQDSDTLTDPGSEFRACCISIMLFWPLYRILIFHDALISCSRWTLKCLSTFTLSQWPFAYRRTCTNKHTLTWWKFDQFITHHGRNAYCYVLWTSDLVCTFRFTQMQCKHVQNWPHTCESSHTHAIGLLWSLCWIRGWWSYKEEYVVQSLWLSVP